MKYTNILPTIILAIPFLAVTPVNNEIDFKETNDRKVIKEPIIIESKPIEIVAVDYEHLINAMIQVESLGNDSVHGDQSIPGGDAVGALQIRPIMIREVNRILKIQHSDTRYHKDDRYIREKTVEMFTIWKDFHHPDGDFEKIARNWNGGPKGYLNNRTVKYWVKVQKELNK